MFASLANCEPDTPFFPASFHEGKDAVFTIGLESGDVVFEAAQRSKDLGEFKRALSGLYRVKLEEVQDVASELDSGLLVELVTVIAHYNCVVRLLASLEIDVEADYQKYLDEFPLPAER